MKIFSFLSRNNTESPLDVIFKQFPFAGAIAVFCTAWLLYIVNAEIPGDKVSQAILICGTAFFFSTGISLLLQTWQIKKYSFFLQLIPLLYA
jgi:hypothetical protein